VRTEVLAMSKKYDHVKWARSALAENFLEQWSDLIGRISANLLFLLAEHVRQSVQGLPNTGPIRRT
jgi:hypothetical protein